MRIVPSFSASTVLLLSAPFAAHATASSHGAHTLPPTPTNALELERRIVAIARANTTRVDNREEVRASLEPLVRELLARVPDKPESADAPLVTGAWKSEWSNLFIDPRADLSRVYQVVFPEGFYYNVSLYTLGATTRTNFLRGAFTDAGDFLDIRFTSDGFAPAWLPTGTDLVTAARLVEDGFLPLEADAGSRAVGRRGTLRNAYVSRYLRVVTGESETQFDRLFILTRAGRVP
jgi:hypothetical protein